MHGRNLYKLNILHFQYALYDLEKGHFEVLQSDEFCRDLQRYLQRLFERNHRDTIIRILEKLGTCVEHENCHLRSKAAEVVREFSTLLHMQRAAFHEQASTWDAAGKILRKLGNRDNLS